MKYLFGNSLPCPIQYNFLSAFETFIESAIQTIRIDQEISSAENRIAAAVASRERALKIVEEFHGKLMENMKKLVDDYDDPNTSAYARQLRDYADGLVSEARSNCKLANDKDTNERGAEFGQRRKELSRAIEEFLKTELMPVQDWSVTMRLDNGSNLLFANIHHPGEIVASFTLSLGQSPWQAPVRVGALSQGFELQLGVRKSWITGSVARSSVSLDDFIVGAFESSDDAGAIHLRKRLDQPDSLVFKLDRKKEKLIVHLEREDDEGDSELHDDDAARVEKLWQMLRQLAKPLLNNRARLLSLSQDEKDVLEAKSVRPFLEGVIKRIAPMVKEIIENSPNPNELSMKIESEEGRREEIYLRKAALIAKLESLDEGGRAIFTPLGLIQEVLTSADVEIEV